MYLIVKQRREEMTLCEHVLSREREYIFLKREKNIIWLFYFYPDTIMSHNPVDMK